MKYFLIIVIVVICISLPYLVAGASGGSNFVFSGFLVNPLDGNSYLAKMYQGWEGSWRFVLPYSSDAGKGAYLFLYYIFLGHLARWTNVSLLWVYHFVRVLNTIIFLVILRVFLLRTIKLEPKLALLAFLLVSLGSGLGWLGLSGFTSDFWVAEAYPFLSAYSNPHFILGLALILSIIILSENQDSLLKWSGIFFLSLGLSIVLPFGVVIAGMVLVGRSIFKWITEKEIDVYPIIFLGLGGGFFILYQFWISLTDPVLKGWNTQNVTTSPPVLDFLISFSPALIAAIFASIVLWRTTNKPAKQILIAWLVLGILLIYIPFNLQRRFMLGLYIPVAILAIWGIGAIKNPSTRQWILVGIVCFSLLTNLLIILAGYSGIQSHSPVIYLTTDEKSALEWVKNSTPAHSLVFASPEMGLFIPAETGRRVVYGHPFETVNAGKEKEKIESFYGNILSTDAIAQYLSDKKPDYIFWGPREQIIGKPLILDDLHIAYQNASIKIFALDQAK
jgi:hypothetical protein